MFEERCDPLPEDDVGSPTIAMFVDILIINIGLRDREGCIPAKRYELSKESNLTVSTVDHFKREVILILSYDSL